MTTSIFLCVNGDSGVQCNHFRLFPLGFSLANPDLTVCNGVKEGILPELKRIKSTLDLRNSTPDKHGFLEYVQDPNERPVVAPIHIHKSVLGDQPYRQFKMTLTGQPLEITISLGQYLINAEKENPSNLKPWER